MQLLSLYHDTLLRRVLTTAPSLPAAPVPSAHARYTKFWTQKSKLYRRVAMLLQMVIYTELLCEMAAKRRGGEKSRWKVVVLLEAIKAICRLVLLRVTRSRPLVTPVLPEREAIPEDDTDLADDETTARSESELMDEVSTGGDTPPNLPDGVRAHEKDWKMPRTGMSLPSLPNPGDISSYLLTRVLTAEDIKPAFKLLNRLRGPSHAAEVLHVLSPLIYAIALARSNRNGNKSSWTPWLVGITAEYAARQLRDRSLRATPLERDEWTRRGWAMGWWTMRGGFYENVTKGVVRGVKGRMPGFVAGILDDYEYLWDNYYFSTSA